MRSRVVSISVLFAVVLLGCGKKVAVNNPALEPTAVLYPFEPIPVASYEGMGLAKHADLRIAQEMARTQAMSDLGSNIFDTVSTRVTEVVNSRNAQSSLLTAARNLSTTLPLVGKKFIEYRVGENTGTVYCRVYMAKSEVDEYMMSKLIELSRNLIDKPIRESLTKQIAGAGAVNADVQSLALFHEQQITKAQAQNDVARKRR
ncbi:MAG TPA: hypothetical protein VE422_33035 [Terriglobia bacterium]|nr:hypothetical protein [Terriglobia bacterium]